ncbi:phage tail tape measure protein [Ancylobacter sp. 6x-1]|uniref:Phage tail tape measure protein n=1 Tax=Ancylobacter crimeensis TaxID=2579147 RepID=A0ABT0DAC3_9HYPH|nr:phage tail tape measure protein [Ancylobacter crimeensis]MCK0196900.1 phage tail tape measure protein [Ancylobacter crimeensis]
MSQPLDIRGVAEISDRVSPTLARISATMAGVARNPALKRVASDMSGLRSASVLTGRALAGVGGALKTVAWNFAAVGSVAALGVATYFGAVATAAYSAAKSFAAAGAEVSDVAGRLGVSGEKLQEWRYAAQASGASAGALDAGLSRLQKTMVDASRGKNKDAAALLHKLGISAKDAKGHIKPLATIMPQLAKAFEKNTDPALRARMAMALFGESGAALVPMLADGKRGLEELAAEARKMGIILSEEDIKRAKRLSDEIDKTGTSLHGLGLTIGSELEPVMTPMLGQFREWIAVNRQWIALKIRQVVESLRDAFKDFDIKGFVEQTERGFRRIDWAIGKIGGWRNAFIGFAAILSSPVWLPLLKTAWAIGTVAGRIVRTGASLLALGGWPVILGVAAIAGALNNWQEFSAGVSGIWNGFKTMFSGDVFGGIVGIWTGVFETLKSIIRGLLAVVDETFGTDLRGALENALSWLGGFLEENLFGPFKRIIDRIKGLWESLSFTVPSINTPATNGPHGETVQPTNRPRGAPALNSAPATPSQPSRGRYGALSDRPSLYAMERGVRQADAGSAVRGGATLNVRFANAPPGTKANVTPQGSIFGDWSLDMGLQGTG